MTNEEFIKSVSLESEIWKDVVGYEGIYMVSNIGRILSLNKEVVGHKSVYNRKPMMIKTRINRNGYVQVILKNNKTQRTFLVHRLVAISHILNNNGKREVDHINTIKTDNRVENLKWCSSKENSNNLLTRKHLSENKNLNKKIGKDNPSSIPVIRISFDGSTKTYESASMTQKDGFTRQEVSYVCKYKKRLHKGYNWMYLKEYKSLSECQRTLAIPDSTN